MTKADEQWRSIPGFRGYEVSDKGRVRSYLTSRGASAPLRTEPRMKKIWVDVGGRDCVTLASATGVRTRSIDTLLRLAFGDREAP